MKGNKDWLVRLRAIISSLILATVVTALVAFILMPSGDGTMSYRSLDYDMTVRPNGDLRVVEHVDVKLGKRRDSDGDKAPWHQLFQRYKLDSKQLSAITDVSVKDAKTGEEYATGDLADDSDLKYTPDDVWDSEFSQTWYAVNVSCGSSVRYKPAGAAGPSKKTDGDRPIDNGMFDGSYGGVVGPQLNSNDPSVPGQGVNDSGVSGNGAETQSDSGNSGLNSGNPDNLSRNSSDSGGSNDLSDSGNSSNPSSYVQRVRPRVGRLVAPIEARAQSQAQPRVHAAADTRDDNGTCATGQSGDTIEIGWNIPATYTAESMKFDIAMTFKDVVTRYDDVAYFKWEPVGDDNSVPIDNLHARVTLPKGRAKSDGSKAADKASSVNLPQQWLHFAGLGDISAHGSHTIEFNAQHVGVRRHVDLVSISPASSMGKVRHTQSGDHAQAVVSHEKAERLKAAVVSTANLIWLVVSVVAVLVALGYLMNKFIRIAPEASYRGEVDYYRDIPEITPVAAAHLMDILEGSPSSRFGIRIVGTKYARRLASRQMAAAMLSLTRKNLIAIYPGKAEWYGGLDLAQADSDQVSQRVRDNASSFGAKTSTIVILPLAYQIIGDSMSDGQRRDELNLTPSEQALLKLLKSFAEHIDSHVFDLKHVRRAGRKWTDGAENYRKFTTEADKEFKHFTLAHSQSETIFKVSVLLVVAAVIAGLYLWRLYRIGLPDLALIAASAATFIAILFLSLMPNETLSADGRKAAGPVLGLRKYMEDFSDFSDRGPQDLALWDQYLIYATALGISGELVRKMAEAQPALADAAWLDENAQGSLLYWTYCGSAWTGVSASGASGFGSSGGFADLGAQLSSGFGSLGASLGGGGIGGSFGGSGGGAGGGSFGGR
ncbi:DUF2207 domain-containing protein [Bifidobacterium sp. ESL0732]|uniref:DUF2207 family protein n=1 Tax=Bifidobacterium sp. ESL0732 TaxID=2983222 RepID=UPI0023F6D362|nr:DUF2207 domain-containing protein [Bifidobacterium sp. ESL0732]WEV63770.1 DUF2207 domain-containing protein [Bifidobacterium sp. ESL0732]